MSKIAPKVFAKPIVVERTSAANTNSVAETVESTAKNHGAFQNTEFESQLGDAAFQDTSIAAPANMAALLLQSKSKIPGEEGAMKLMRAMKGLGTDEQAIFETLNGNTSGERLDIKTAFKSLYKISLEDRLAGDLSGMTHQRALGALRGDDITLTEKSPRGAYQPVGIYAPTMRGATLKVAAFLSSSWLTQGLVQNQVKKELQFDSFKAIDLSAYPKLAEPSLPKKTVAASSAIDSLLSDETTLGAPLTISALHQAYKEQRTTPLAVAQAFLQRVKNDPTNSFVHVDERGLLEAAAASTDRYKNGTELGPLDGMTMSVKDQIDVAGMPTTVGTNFLGEKPAEKDARVIKNLRTQGVLIVGKTVMNELGFGANGMNAHHGVVKNPHDLNKSAGGSSSGSATSVASGLVVAAVGSDSGGSTRVPASLNGLFGLKPTWGNLSNEGNYALTPSTMQPGPIANTAEDTAMLYAAMAGGVNLDGFAEQDLKGITVGVYRDYSEHADPEIVAATQKMEKRLKSRGATIREIVIDDLNLAPAAQILNFGIEAGRTQSEHRANGMTYGGDTQVNLDVAASFDASLLAQAQRARGAVTAGMNAAMEGIDMVLTPMTAMTAPRLTASVRAESNVQEAEALLRFSVVPSITGRPALTVPAGKDESGMPMGIQLIGNAHDEKTLLRAANAITL